MGWSRRVGSGIAYKWVGLAGNYLLMMFYTVVAGWMLAFMVKSAMGEFNGASTEHVGKRVRSASR